MKKSSSRALFAVLALVVVLALAACGSGSPSGGGSAQGTGGAPTPNSIAMKNFSFEPGNVEVKAGTTVTWTNQDSTAHTVTADDNSFKSEQIAPGATFSHAFPSAGTFKYHCSIHPSMVGQVVVK